MASGFDIYNVVLKLTFLCQDNHVRSWMFYDLYKDYVTEENVALLVNAFISGGSIFVHPPVTCVSADLYDFSDFHQVIGNYHKIPEQNYYFN